MSHYLNVTKTDNQRNNKTVIASMESMLNKLDELDALLALESQIIDNPSLEADNPLLLYDLCWQHSLHNIKHKISIVTLFGLAVSNLFVHINRVRHQSFKLFFRTNTATP